MASTPRPVLRDDDLATFNSMSGDARRNRLETNNIAMDFADIVNDLMQGECSQAFIDTTRVDKFIHYHYYFDPERTMNQVAVPPDDLRDFLNKIKMDIKAQHDILKACLVPTTDPEPDETIWRLLPHSNIYPFQHKTRIVKGSVELLEQLNEPLQNIQYDLLAFARSLRTVSSPVKTARYDIKIGEEAVHDFTLGFTIENPNTDLNSINISFPQSQDIRTEIPINLNTDTYKNMELEWYAAVYDIYLITSFQKFAIIMARIMNYNRYMYAKLVQEDNECGVSINRAQLRSALQMSIWNTGDWNTASNKLQQALDQLRDETNSLRSTYERVLGRLDETQSELNILASIQFLAKNSITMLAWYIGRDAPDTSFIGYSRIITQVVSNWMESIMLHQADIIKYQDAADEKLADITEELMMMIPVETRKEMAEKSARGSATSGDNSSTGRKPEETFSQIEIDVFKGILADLNNYINMWFKPDNTPRTLPFKDQKDIMEKTLETTGYAQGRINFNKSLDDKNMVRDSKYKDMKIQERWFMLNLKPKVDRMEAAFKKAEKVAENAKQITEKLVTDNVSLPDAEVWDGGRSTFLPFFSEFIKTYCNSVLKENPYQLKKILLGKVKINPTARRLVETSKNLNDAMQRLETTFGNKTDYAKALAKTLEDLRFPRENFKIENQNILQLDLVRQKLLKFNLVDFLTRDIFLGFYYNYLMRETKIKFMRRMAEVPQSPEDMEWVKENKREETTQEFLEQLNETKYPDTHEDLDLYASEERILDRYHINTIRRAFWSYIKTRNAEISAITNPIKTLKPSKAAMALTIRDRSRSRSRDSNSSRRRRDNKGRRDNRSRSRGGSRYESSRPSRRDSRSRSYNRSRSGSYSRSRSNRSRSNSYNRSGYRNKKTKSKSVYQCNFHGKETKDHSTIRCPLLTGKNGPDPAIIPKMRANNICKTCFKPHKTHEYLTKHQTKCVGRITTKDGRFLLVKCKYCDNHKALCIRSHLKEKQAEEDKRKAKRYSKTNSGRKGDRSPRRSSGSRDGSKDTKQPEKSKVTQKSPLNTTSTDKEIDDDFSRIKLGDSDSEEDTDRLLTTREEESEYDVSQPEDDNTDSQTEEEEENIHYMGAIDISKVRKFEEYTSSEDEIGNDSSIQMLSVEQIDLPSTEIQEGPQSQVEHHTSQVDDFIDQQISICLKKGKKNREYNKLTTYFKSVAQKVSLFRKHMRKWDNIAIRDRYVPIDRLISMIVNITNLYRELKILIGGENKKLFTDDIILQCDILEHRRKMFFEQTENKEHEYEQAIETEVRDEVLIEQNNTTGQISRVNLTGYAPNITVANGGNPEDFDPFFRCPVRACQRPYGLMSSLMSHIEDEHQNKYGNTSNMEQL